MRLYNVDHSPVVVKQNERAVMPCLPYEFTDEEVAAGIAGLWSEENPREGLEQERVFKARRDREASAAGRDHKKE